MCTKHLIHTILVVLEDCVFSDNHGGNAFDNGNQIFPEAGPGALYLEDNINCVIRHCTFANNIGGDVTANPNSMPGAGTPGTGGLRTFNTMATVENCIFWGNVAGQASGSTVPSQMHITGTTTTVSTSDIQGGTLFGPGLFIIDADPLFTSPAAGDYSLQPGSPCIDAADCGAVNPFKRDVAGQPRLRGFAPDMGAYEYQHDTTRIGTSEDLLLTTVVNGDASSALVNTKNLAGGDALLIHWESPCAHLDGFAYYVGVQFHDQTLPPIPPAPFVYIDAMGGAIVQGPAPLSPGGQDMVVMVPPGSFMPTIVRLQVLVATSLANTLPFAVTSDAQDLVFQ